MRLESEVFKAYDVRGIYPSEIDEEAAYLIGQAYVKLVKPKKVLVGRDVRLSSPSMWKAIVEGVTDAGVDVMDPGIISTDMLYFAVAFYGFDGGFSVTASHNPKEYTGVKFVREEAKPVSSDTGLFHIRDEALKQEKFIAPQKGRIEKIDILGDYLKHILSFVDLSKIKPLKIVVNTNFGAASQTLERLVKYLPVELIKLNFEMNGEFPKGRPDPLIPENRTELTEAVLKNKADLGVAWDADADRCFFCDEKGNFLEGYFITALLAKAILKKHPGEKIISEPRLVWAVRDTVAENGGVFILSKAGHAFIKERMRKENAIFAGEMSAHYYFRDNYYADNGMIPFLMILELISQTGQSLSQLVQSLVTKYFVSGEINLKVADINAKIKEVESYYNDGRKDFTDGLSVDYPNWRFNLRASNTEPLIRLNVEALSQELMAQKRDDLLDLIRD
ncbi:MAG: phosphomannomutase/phosphoglucomutase [Patescibacteria group bacterium]|nr:phosphomannomutase/phosphoglucomutase [Patescibacteria group bacterium]